MTSLSLKNSISSVLNQSISQIQKSTPLAVGLLLSSAALLPTIQSAPAELAAELAIGGTLLSGLGTNLITDLIKEKLYKVAGKKDEEILKETEKALLELWNEGGKKGEDFRKELSAFLQRNGILQMAMDGAPQETKNALLSSFAELAEKFDEFNWALKYIQESLAEISATGRQQVEASNEILAKVNLLLQMQRENQKKAPLPLEPKQGEEEQPRTEIENPYKGLAFFTQADGNTYFGREELTAQLLAKLAGSPFLALLGASGSGKSSLMRAGVIWALYTGGIPGSENWKVLVMRPGATPLEDLAAQVSAESRSVSSSLIREIKTDPSALRLEAKKILLNLPDDAKLVLAVDQFEEVFTQCQDENERGQFIAALTDAAQHSNSRIVVLLTLRADYYGRCSAYPALAKLLSENQVLVGEMTDTELRRAISAPTENVGVRVEAGLPELIIEEARGEKGALPMISLALAELFKNRKTDTLKVAEYRELGGLNQVIATTADKVYLSLSQAEQSLAQKILLDLVKTGETAEQDARQRVRLSAIMPAGGNRLQAEELLNKLADARLIVKDGESEDAQVEVSHEALFRHWDKLRNWLEEAREEKNLRQKISEAANEWKQNNKDANLLVHRGGRLDDALKLDNLNPAGLEYIKACDALRRKEQRERERRTRITIFASIAAAVVFLVLGTFGLIQSREATNQAATAQEQTRIAVSRQLAAEGQSLAVNGSSKNMIAELLAIQSLRLYPSDEASNLLLSSTLSPTLASVDLGFAVESVTFSPDNKFAAVGNSSAGIYVLEIPSGIVISKITNGSTSLLNKYPIVFSPDSKYLAAENLPGEVCIWEVKTGNELECFQNDSWIYSIAYSSDGKYIAFGGGRGHIQVWNVLSGEQEAYLEIGDEYQAVYYVNFSPDGKYLISGGGYGDGLVQVWDWEKEEKIIEKKIQGSVYTADISHDGQYAIAGTLEGVVIILDIASGEIIYEIKHEGPVEAVKFSPNGDFFASGGCDGYVNTERCKGVVHVWDIGTGGKISTIRHDDVVWSLEFTPDSNYLVSGSADGTARVSVVKTGEEITSMTHSTSFDTDTEFSGSTGVWDVAVSPDGQYVISGGYDNTARLWKLFPEKQYYQFLDGSESIQDVAISTDGRHIASGGNYHVKIWDMASNKMILEIERPVYNLWFTSDGEHILLSGNETVLIELSTGREVYEIPENQVKNVSLDKKYFASYDENNLRIFEVSTGKEIGKIPDFGFQNIVEFSPGNQYLVAGDGNDKGTIHVWEISTGKEISSFTHEYSVNSVAFSPDEKYIASGGDDTSLEFINYFFCSIASEIGLNCGNYFIAVWEVETGKEIARLHHDGEINSISFSPNGEYIASGSDDNTARVWNVSSGTEIARVTHDINGIEDSVFSVEFSPNGKYVLSIGGDRRIRVWDAFTGQDVSRVKYDGFISSAKFSYDGKYVVSGGRDGVVRIWASDLISDACSRVTRNLTLSEWRQYVGDTLPYQAICPNFALDPEFFKDIVYKELNNREDSNRVKNALSAVKKELRALSFISDLDETSKNIVTYYVAQYIYGDLSFGRIEESIVLLDQAKEEGLPIEDANTLNNFCWFGSLSGYAEQVMQKCELAVQLDGSNPNIRDSRGLARALTGDLDGAIDDFQHFVDNSTDYDAVQKRIAWIEELKIGINPFTPDLLESLKYE